ncbi:MAG: transporter substrate-binding domain-containing protein [Motiliproteus sp.]|nr:transporter substrate-binding domain-containing protein [Motiliproteus sp.]MCW9054007.1 transporter substrate-binding domain-containing protein [Motiliproteus sp.]
MRTFVRGLVAGLALSLMGSSVFAAEAGLCKVLSATGNSEYPPYLWREDKGGSGLLGSNRIIMDEIAKRLGVSIDLQDVGSWARAQEMAKKGHIDLIAGAFYTVPRIQYMDYVYPAFLDTTSVVWKKQGQTINYSNREDLIPMMGVTVINNSFGQVFDEFAKDSLNIEYVASLEQAFKMIDHKRADYVLYEKNPGLAYANIWGMGGRVEAMEPAISSEGLYLTISHRSKCNTGALRGRLAKVIQEMTAEGFMQKALQQGLQDWREFTR